MYKLILIDLDGTLLNDDKDIIGEDIEYIQYLLRKDYHVVIATGRSYHSAKELIAPLKRNLPIIANNGSIIRYSKDDETIGKNTLNTSSIDEILSMGKQYDLFPIFHVDGYRWNYDIVMGGNPENEADRFYYQRFEDRVKKIEQADQIKDEDVLAMIFLGKRDKMEYVESQIEPMSLPIETHVVTNFANFEAMLEVMNRGSTKWEAAMKYARLHGVKPGEVIAFGDDRNDLSMVKEAGLGVAMKNASELIKSHAKSITTADNNHGGVSRMLKQILE